MQSDDIIGYRGVGPERGKYIETEDALAYAMERCGISWRRILWLAA